ncbi:hypothetical protein ACWEVN_14810, partial [Amycolatopsis sp. NPDC003861]
CQPAESIASRNRLKNGHRTFCSHALLSWPAAALGAYEADRIPRYARAAELSAAVEHAPTPQGFARHYAAFSHWMLTSSAGNPVPA